MLQQAADISSPVAAVKIVAMGVLTSAGPLLLTWGSC
jgi:hypothetical protein